MIFNDIPFHRKNKILLIGAVFLLLISWMFSFSKAWNAYSQNKKLTGQVSTTASSAQFAYAMQQKFIKLDSLVKQFTLDSVAFENNFITNVSQCIEELPIELIYDEQKTKQTSIHNIQSKSIILQGDYKTVVKAIERLEKYFFVGRISYYKGMFFVEMR